MASVNRDEEQRWVPTHVQVLVIRARGLRAKGKHGTSDAYAVVQLGKEKYSTCVMEKTIEPEWGEECSFELQPGVLEDRGRETHTAGICDLTFTVMHRALIGLDVFLGQTVIALDKAFRERACMRNEWYKLHSKTGKKEKERGELQLTVQFTRHNLTASMYDLSIKDKPRSAFIRLRERMRARKRAGDEESSSAIVPGGYGALARTRSRLPSDGGGEEDYEDDEGGELRRSKMRSYFLHGRLRKSSDTRSSTSLGSESSESSSRGGSLSPTAGISVVVSDLSNSPSNSSNLTADNSPEHTLAPSPLVSPVRNVFDEVCDFSIPVPHSLTTDSDAPILLPSVCVNGNPVETSPLTHQPPLLVLQQPRPQAETQQESQKTPQPRPLEKGKSTRAQTVQSSEIKPQHSPDIQTRQHKKESKSKPDLQFPTLGLLQKGSALSLSLQNLSHRNEEQQGGGPVDGRRWSFDKPGEEEKAAIAAALEHTGLMADEMVVEAVASVSEIEVLGKKKRSVFSHAWVEKEETRQVLPASEGRHRGWFSSKDPYSKPSQQVGPQTDSSSGTTLPPLSLFPTDVLDRVSYQHTNPFNSASIISCANPFFSLLQQNPFFQELYTVTPLTPALPFLCSPAIYQPEVPASRPRNPSPPLHVVEAGNAKGTPVDGSSFSLTASHCKTDALKKKWDDFIGDRLKLKSEIGPQKITDPSSCLIKPTDLTPACSEGGLFVSSNTTPACTLNADALPHVEAEAKFMHCTTQKTDPTNFIPRSVSESKYDPSLHFNSSTEFSEINALACPYPTLLNSTFINDKVSAVTGCKINSTPNATPVQSVTPKPVALNPESSDYLALDKKSDHEKLKCLFLKMQADDDTKGYAEIQKTSLPCYNLDIQEASFIETSESLSRADNVPESKFKSDYGIDLSNVSFTKQKVCNLMYNPSKGSLKIDCLSETLSGLCEVVTPNSSRQTLSSSVSSGYVPSHSFCKSIDSEQYLTCMSQHSSLTFSQQSPVANLKSETFQECKPKSGLSQEVLPTNDQSPRNISELQQEPVEISQKALPKNEVTSPNDPLNSSVSHIFLPKSVSSQNTLERCDIKEAITGAVLNESIQKYDPSIDKNDLLHERIPDTFKMTTMAGEELLMSSLHTYKDSNICSTKLHQSHCVQCDGALEDLEIITDFCQSIESKCVPEFVSVPPSSITQDLVTTDLLLENVFVAQHAATHSVGTSSVAHPVPREPWHIALCPDSIKALQISKNMQATTNSASVPQGEHLDSTIHWSTFQPPLCETSTLDQLTSGHDLLMSSPLSLLDLSPLASSTPHVAVGINSLPLSRFPMPSAPAKLLPHTALLAAALPSAFAPPHDPFPQQEQHLAHHLSSPHPVKPLTPPDEKRSEGRSVFEKLRSTIHPGRGHQGDQESEKKLLVEGGGSYYHLSHSELVSLLLQRDAELQQEREEYWRRGLLLEKREVELKKMKVIIRDLEDYIDTLLVRIMEQTPALLQVRSKLK